MKSARLLSPESWGWYTSALMDWRGSSDHPGRSSKRYAGRSDGRTVGRSDWDSDKESLWLGSLRRDPNRTRLSSSPWEQKKHFSLHSPLPSCHSIPTLIAGSASSAFARSAHSRRSPKQRSRHSSALWGDI